MNYKYQPKDYNELMKNIENEIYNIQGTSDNPNWQADLNCIDTLQINRILECFLFCIIILMEILAGGM